MSGHNRWTQIKRQKAVTDSKKSKIFSTLAKTIAIEAKRCGGDKNDPALRRVIAKARENNMPNDNIDRAIKNALGGDAVNYEEVIYEAYGPSGVAIIIEGITDNRNRSSQEIKHLLSSHGGNLAVPGSVTWAFTKSSEGWQANNPLPLASEESRQLKQLIESLEENGDIKNIYTNANFGD